MNCHACGDELTIDDYGHPVHQGPCPGPPVHDGWTCDHCATVFATEHARNQHHRRCTADDPAPPRKDAYLKACERCHLRHTPKCSQTVWPFQPLIDSVGQDRLMEVLDLDWTQIARRQVAGVPTYMADRWALAFGLHPCHVWGWAWFADALPGWHDASSVDGWRQAFDWSESLNQPATEVAA